jgi:hypothetical protein
MIFRTQRLARDNEEEYRDHRRFIHRHSTIEEESQESLRIQSYGHKQGNQTIQIENDEMLLFLPSLQRLFRRFTADFFFEEGIATSCRYRS